MMLRSLLLSNLLLVALGGIGHGQDLVARYSFDEIGGTDFNDTAFNDQNGTWTNGAALAQPGIVGGAVDLDPLSLQRGDLLSSTKLDTLLIDCTVCAWVNPETLGGVRRVFGNDGSWAFGLLNDSIRFTTRTILDYDIAAGVPTGTWSHIAAVFDANADVTFYMNGALLGTVTGNQSANAPFPDWHVGALRVDFELWDGLLDDIQVYSGSATGTQIASLFQNPGSTLDDIGTGYCMPNANSTGAPSLISALGTDSVGANNVRLVATNVPRFSFAFFLTSRMQTFTANPAGSQGNLCLGGAVGRYVGPGQIQQARQDLTVSLRLNLTMTPDPQLGLIPILAGETWNFQTWYRDSVGGTSTSNFSDAVSVQFQ